MADTKRLLANPGTPSSSTWPSASRLYFGSEPVNLIDALMEARFLFFLEMSGELHGNPQIAKRVLLISLQLICQNFFPFFRAPWDLSETTPYGPGHIMKIFQALPQNLAPVYRN